MDHIHGKHEDNHERTPLGKNYNRITLILNHQISKNIYIFWNQENKLHTRGFYVLNCI